MKANNPMHRDLAKILQFYHKGTSVTIQGFTNTPDQVTPISATQLYKSSQGNDIWAYVIVDQVSPGQANATPAPSISEDLKLLFDLYADSF